MIPVNTYPIIALMQNIEIGRNLTRNQAPRHAVRIKCAILDPKLSILASAFTGSPHPARTETGVMGVGLIGERTVFIDLGPKPFLVLGREIGELNRSVLHNVSVLSVRAISEFVARLWLALFTPASEAFQA